MWHNSSHIPAKPPSCLSKLDHPNKPRTLSTLFYLFEERGIQHFQLCLFQKWIFLFPFYGRILSFDVGRMRPFSSQVSIYQS